MFICVYFRNDDNLFLHHVDNLHFALNSYYIDVYTLPICTSSFKLTWPCTKRLLTTFPMKNTLDPTMMDHIDKVYLKLEKDMTAEVGQQICNRLKRFCIVFRM